FAPPLWLLVGSAHATEAPTTASAATPTSSPTNRFTFTDFSPFVATELHEHYTVGRGAKGFDSVVPRRQTSVERSIVGERAESESSVWPGGIAAITLFVEDLGAARRFYEDVFKLPVHYEDEHSTVFQFGDTIINLLTIGEAPGLVEPATVAPP